jgi:hypothetical protein
MADADAALSRTLLFGHVVSPGVERRSWRQLEALRRRRRIRREGLNAAAQAQDVRDGAQAWPDRMSPRFELNRIPDSDT